MKDITLTQDIQNYISKYLSKKINPSEKDTLERRTYMFLLNNIDEINADTSSFTVTIEDTSVATYSLHTKESITTVNGTGLENTIKSCEKEFTNSTTNSKIRTDGWVTYEVSIKHCGNKIKLPISLFKSFVGSNKQSFRDDVDTNKLVFRNNQGKEVLLLTS